LNFGTPEALIELLLKGSIGIQLLQQTCQIFMKSSLIKLQN